MSNAALLAIIEITTVGLCGAAFLALMSYHDQRDANRERDEKILAIRSRVEELAARVDELRRVKSREAGQ